MPRSARPRGDRMVTQDGSFLCTFQFEAPTQSGDDCARPGCVTGPPDNALHLNLHLESAITEGNGVTTRRARIEQLDGVVESSEGIKFPSRSPRVIRQEIAITSQSPAQHPLG